MRKKRYRPEEIISKLREADILLEQGQTVAQVIKSIEVSDVTYLLREDGWLVNHKRVERIWRQEGLKVPKKQQA